MKKILFFIAITIATQSTLSGMETVVFEKKSKKNSEPQESLDGKLPRKSTPTKIHHFRTFFSHDRSHSESSLSKSFSESYLTTKKKSPKNNIQRSNPEIKRHINIKNQYGNTALILAAISNKTTDIIELIKDPNVIKYINAQNIYGYTALHYIAGHKNREAIDLFFLIPEVDFTLRSKNLDTAQSMITDKSSDEDKKMCNYIFARIMLDTKINEVCCDENQQELFFPAWISQLGNPLELQALINALTQTIKNAIILDEKKQEEGGRELPESAKFPAYATDDFIYKALISRFQSSHK